MSRTGALDYLTETLQSAVDDSRLVDIRGRVTEVQGMILKAAVPGVRIGELCELFTPGEEAISHAEVVGFEGYDAVLTPLGEMLGISSNTEVIPTGRVHHVGVGPHLPGQVLDGMGKPLHDNAEEPVTPDAWYPV